MMASIVPSRRFSGSRYRDEYELEFSDLSPSRASSPASARSEGPRIRHNPKVDEYRRKIARLKSELELEKSKSKHVLKEKSKELKHLRSQHDEDKKSELQSIEERLKERMKKDVIRMREELIKEKDAELQQVLKYKEDEIEQLKSRLSQSENRKHRRKPDDEKHLAKENGTNSPEGEKHLKGDSKESGTSERSGEAEKSKGSIRFRDMDIFRKMEEEIQNLKDENVQWEEKYRRKCKEEVARQEELNKVKAGYDAEVRRVISESKKLALGNLKKLKRAEIALSESFFSEDESVTCSLTSTPASVCSNIVTTTTMSDSSHRTTPSEGVERMLPQLPMEDGCSRSVSVVDDVAMSRRSSITSLARLFTGDHSETTPGEQTKQEEREKERQLQKKITEYQTQIQRLERRINLLRTENESLRRQKDDQKPLEEKIKSLKKRNAELAAIARRLEEKTKSLQQENLKRNKEDGGQESEHIKRLFARQRAKDLAEHAKNMLAKDREIEDLRKKCQELASQLSNGEFYAPENVQVYEEKEELVTIIKQAAKERLQLERQLTRGKPGEVVQQIDPEHTRQLKELEEANNELKEEVKKLDKALQLTNNLKTDLRAKEEECEVLHKTIEQQRHHTEELEDQLKASESRNTQQSLELADLHNQLADLEKVNEQCSTLRVSLAEAQQERELARNEVSSLHYKINSLENLVKELQQSTAKLQQLEYDYQVALQRNEQKQEEINRLHQCQHEARLEHEKAVEELKIRIQDLEKQCRQHKLQQQQLSSELSLLKSKNEVFKPTVTVSAQIQTESPSFRTTGTDALPLQYSPHFLSSYSNQNGQRPEIQGREDSGMENNRETKNQNEISLSDSRLSSLSRKGPLQVYIAKYSYNPYQQSPNDNPAAELPLSAGDYVLILGDMDEDGFYEGELIHGKRGLVPSNFIEKVSDDHLSEFHAAMALACHHSDESTVNSIQHDLDFNSSDEADFAGVPHPTCLSLDRQLTNSILVSWKAPEVSADVVVQSYHVLVDGEFITSIRGNERTKALIEGIDSKLTHRICVRCLSNQGQSKDGQCTLLIGKDVLPVPSDIIVSDITANSAVISWMPGNSNYPHCIEVNGQDVHLLKPGVCKYRVSGLAPSCTHTIRIYVREAPEYTQSLHLLSVTTEFTTLKGGSPDPPLNVQVEAGPQEGTLLLTWLPMTINPSGVSNGAVVAGYVVYVDGRRTKEAKGPTNDHIILGPDDLKGHIPKQLTVRTLAVDGKESAESTIIRLPQQLIRELSTTISKPVVTSSPKTQTKSSKSPTTGSVEHAGSSTDAKIDAAFEGVLDAADDVPVSPVEHSQYADPFVESSSSELSDIPEVEEELIGSEESNQIPGYTGQSTNQQQDKQLSPQPAPRTIRLSPSPAPHQPQRSIPAIEITRDSSSERGTSFEEDLDPVKVTKQTSPSDNHEIIPSRKTPPGSIPSTHRNATPQHSTPHRTTPEVKARSPGSPKYAMNADGREGFREKNVNVKNDGQNANYRLPRHSTSPTKSPQEAGFHSNKAVDGGAGMRPISLNDSEDYDDNCDVDSISGEINPPIDDNKKRLFVALFDYEPSVMSPNTDALDEELPFREGQILTIYGEKDADGFYRGECNGRTGYVPCNMVSEIHIDDPSLIDELLKESSDQPRSPLSSDKTYSVKAEINHQPQDHLTPNGISSVPSEGAVRQMLALYDYDPQELSPNVDAELEINFKAGDIITVYGEMDEDGFYRGECNGIRGYVPSNFLQEIPTAMSDDDVLESASMVSPSRSGESISAVSRHSDAYNNIGVEPTSPQRDTITLDPVIPLSTHSSTPSQVNTQDEGKKKKGGILNRGRNIFKKLAR